MNPGDTAPPSGRRLPAAPLNEGRGMNPGDTLRRHPGQEVAERSTKAGG